MHHKSSLTKFRRAQTVTFHGEGDTERDIAAKSRCSKTAVVKFHVDCTFRAQLRGKSVRLSILHGGPIELFLVPANAPRLV